MTKRVKFQEMMDSLRRSFDGVPDRRKGQNARYEIRDAGLSAFSVFYMQSPSFLAYQRQMERERGRNNARSLFKVKEIPSDNQIRNLLDPVAPSYVRSPFWDIFEMLRVRGHLDSYRSVGNTWLCSLDGTGYFSSKKIHCDQCTRYERQEGTGLSMHIWCWRGSWWRRVTSR